MQQQLNPDLQQAVTDFIDFAREHWPKVDLEVHERIENGSQIWQRLIEQWAPETLE